MPIPKSTEPDMYKYNPRTASKSSAFVCEDYSLYQMLFGYVENWTTSNTYIQ